MIRLRLTRKLAAKLNGIDLSCLKIGDIIELPDTAARMMIAEGWAEPVFDPATSKSQNPSGTNATS